MGWARKVNWTGLIFGSVGLIFIGFTIKFVSDEKIGSATATFGFSIFSFFFALLSRFKHIKGLGFEAELWEDKQKEAAELIDRLKDVVAIYSSEIVMGKVKAGRFSDGKRWRTVVPLYDSLVQQHNVLGQRIDFSGLKREMDTFMLLDCCYWLMKPIDEALMAAKHRANALVDADFKKDQDSVRYNARKAMLDFSTRVENNKELSEAGTLASRKLALIEDARSRLQREFGMDLDLDPAIIDRLRRLDDLYRNRPVQITPEILAWADGDAT